MENKKIDEIKKYLIKGASLASILALMGTGTACNTTIPTDTTASTKEPGIHDTTTLPGDDTTTTLPGNDTTTTQGLSKEDQAFLDSFYASLASFDKNYKNGIGFIAISPKLLDSNTTEYLVRIGFGNSNSVGDKNLSFNLYNQEGEEFINKCKSFYQYKEKNNSIYIQSKLYSSPTLSDIEFYKYLNTYTSEAIKTQELEQ